MPKERTSEVELLKVHYDENSPSDEGSLLVRVVSTGDVLLCCDVDCGGHFAKLKKNNRYRALFMTFGAIEPVADAAGSSAEISRNEHDGVTSMTGKVDDRVDEWIICDVGFPVYAMPVKKNSSIKKGDIVSIFGGLRVELILQ